jgi:hypothetical protein
VLEAISPAFLWGDDGARWRGLVCVLTVIALLWTVAASHWIVTGTVVPWDAKNQFYAFFRFLAATLHAGHTPFWNPYHYGGHPSVADPQSLVFAPAFVLWALFDPAPSMRAFDLIVYAHLLVGGLAVGAIGWRAGWPLPASVLAATVFMFGGPAAGRLQHTGTILSYALFPPALLLMQLALERRSPLLGGAFGIVAAVLALGRNHEALLLCFVLTAFLGARIADAPQRLSYLRQRAGTLAAMGGVTIVILAVPLLLTLQFAQLSNRPEVPLDMALEASLHPANLASLAVANSVGSLEVTRDYWGPDYRSVPEVAATDRSFNYLFVSASVTLVVLWFGFAGGWATRRGTRLVTATIALSLLYALGRYTPIYPFAFEHVPGIDLFRRPIDAAFVLVAMVALLAGQLLSDYVAKGIPRPPRWRIPLVATFAVGAVGWAIVFSQRSEQGWASAWEVAKIIPLIVLLITILTRAQTVRARTAAAAWVALVATAELLWCNTASPLNAEGPDYYAVLEHPTGNEAAALRVLEQEIAGRNRAGERPRIEIVGAGGPWQNLAMTLGLEATNGYNPLRIGAYDRLVAPGETTYLLDQRLFPASFDGYDSSLARELGLEYVVLGQPIEDMPHLVRRPVAQVLLAGPDVWIYRLLPAEPRLKFISRVLVADTDALVRAGQFKIAAGANIGLIDEDTAPTRSYWPAAVRRQPEPRLLAWAPDRLDIALDAAQPGVLVVHDLYYPGWTAEVDGKPARILRTNELFRGVEVGEGRHMVVFRFQPFALSNLRDALLGALGRGASSP